MREIQRSNIERYKLIEEGKGICIDETIKQNEIINTNFKSQVSKNVIILFKCKKNTKNTDLLKIS